MDTLSIGEVLREAARSHPDREVYVDGERRVTYGELDASADRAAAALIDAGASPGSVVCLLLGNGVDFPRWYLGASRAGAITSAVNLRLGARERSDIIARTAPAVTVIEPGGEPPEAAGTVLTADHPGAEPTPLPRVSPSDPVCVVWTSGTTGLPKGAVYDHECQAEISRGMGDIAAADDRRLFVLPMPHVGYMTRVWDDFAKRITTVFAGEPWSAGRTLEIAERERITMMTGVPTQWQLILDHPDCDTVDWSRVRVAGIGAAAIPPELIRRMRATLGVPVIQRYTSTEAGLTTGTRVDDPPEVTALTVGVPSPVVDLRIVDADTDTEVPNGVVGEIRCRSRAMFRGYWHDPDASAAALDDDGYLHTGDLGTIGADGNLRIVGRLKEMYVRGGYNVYPVEVEAALLEHPAVARAAVVAYPDPMLGERGCAFVVVEAECDPPSLDDLRAWSRERIADYKAPDRVVVLESLPMTSMMKIDKQALAHMVEADA